MLNYIMVAIPNEKESCVMSGIHYEIQSRNLKSFKHTFDYRFCKMKYDEYASMSIDEFKKCLEDPQKLGEIGHLCCFILWIKNMEGYEYRDALGDYGLIHLLFHCVENTEHIQIHAEYIHMLFKEDIQLV